MKIIKQGTPPQDREYRFGCRSCGTIFVCKGSEIKRNYSYTGESYNECNCPTCGHCCFNYDT